MHSRPLRWITLTLALALPLSAADPELLRLARRDVNFLVGVRVSDIAGSPLVTTMLDEALASNPEWEQLMSMAGPNPLAGFDEVLFAAKIDEQSPQEPKNALVLLRGNFGQGLLNNVFCSDGCEREQYRKLEMIKVERKDADTPGFLATLNDQYAVLGERPAVSAAVDRYLNRQSAGLSPAMQGWIDRLGRYHFWLAAKGPFDTGSPDAPGPAAMAASAASKMEGFGLGLLLDNDISLSVELESVTDADAKQVYETLQGLLALGRMSQQQQQTNNEPDAFDLLENLKLVNAGRVVTASLTVPQREVTRQLRAKLNERTDEGDQELSAGLHADGAPQPEPSPAPRASRRSSGAIRVYGLEPRAVEYPLTPK